MKKTILSTKNEPYVFWSLVFLGILPLLLSKYYVTLDGPSHLYNGNIIKELLLGKNQEFRNLFTMNHLIVPNWSVHFLFSVLLVFLPDYLAEKIVLLAFFVLVPLFFRKISLHLAPENKFLSYLMIPFCHNHLLYFGFYNFIYGILFFFIVVYYLLKYLERFDWLKTLGLSLLLLGSYFSHAMVFMITISVLMVMPLFTITIEKKGSGFALKNISSVVNTLVKILVAALPSLVLLIIYLVNVDSLEEAKKLDFGTSIRMVLDIRPLLTLSTGITLKLFSWILFCSLLVLLGVGAVYTFAHKTADQNNKNRGISHLFSIIWFLFAFVFLVLLFIVPNSNLLPDRLILIFYIFFILGISTLRYPRFLQNISFIVILAVLVNSVGYHVVGMRKLSRSVENIKEVTQYVEPGSFLLPFNFSPNWLHTHAAGYFGSGKPIAVIENYEGYLAWFPVTWNNNGPYNLDGINIWSADNKDIVTRMFIHQADSSVFSLKTKENQLVDIPYVVTFGNSFDGNQDNNKEIERILLSGYDLVFENDLCHLYKLK